MAGRLSKESENRAPDSWKKFYIIVAGETLGAHRSVVSIFNSVHQAEANSPEEANYCLLFCPISTRVGTDVAEAMEHLPADKPAVLVVMHHTFNPEEVIPPSSRLVIDPRVRLTLDCLFHKNTLLSCDINRDMTTNISTFFGVSQSKALLLRLWWCWQVFQSVTLYMFSWIRSLCSGAHGAAAAVVTRPWLLGGILCGGTLAYLLWYRLRGSPSWYFFRGYPPKSKWVEPETM